MEYDIDYKDDLSGAQKAELTFVNGESEEAVSNNKKIDNEEEIKNYLSELFKIPIEKIKLYSMGG